MKSLYLLIIISSTSVLLFAQDTTDVFRIKNLKYMEYADKINCDSINGSNFEIRICLNKEFQKVDSVMNLRYITLLKSIENDSIKVKIKKYQQVWVENRRFQSKWISNGMQGHMLGIIYLGSMVTTTNQRIDELEYLLRIQ